MGQGAVVGIVVLNWNGREDTLRCLRSLEHVTYPDMVVLVVDNGSTDGSVAAIRAAHPTIELLPLGRNTGFTGGNNAGLTELLGRGVDALGVLNNDTVVPPGFLEPIVAALETDPNAFVSPRVVHLDDPELSWFDGAVFNPDTYVSHNVDVTQLSAEDRDLDLRPTPVIPGASMFATRELWERVGLFDDRYFLIFEDSDWCERARKAGANGYVVTKSTILHAVSSSFMHSTAQSYYVCRNAFLFLPAHGPKPFWNCYYFLKGQLTESLRTLWHERSRRALRAPVAQLEGILDAMLRHWSARRWYWMDAKR